MRIVTTEVVAVKSRPAELWRAVRDHAERREILGFPGQCVMCRTPPMVECASRLAHLSQHAVADHQITYLITMKSTKLSYSLAGSTDHGRAGRAAMHSGRSVSATNPLRKPRIWRAGVTCRDGGHPTRPKRARPSLQDVRPFKMHVRCSWPGGKATPREASRQRGPLDPGNSALAGA